MNKNLILGIILVSIGMILFIGYLIFAGAALSNSLWTDNPIPVFISIYLGLFLIASLVVLFAIGFIQIKKQKRLVHFRHSCCFYPYQQLFNIVILLFPFHIPYVFKQILDNIFVGLGRTII